MGPNSHMINFTPYLQIDLVIDRPYCVIYIFFMKSKTKLVQVRPIFFTVACIFVYAGSVNYGAFDFLPAIPFLIYAFYAAVKWKRYYAIVFILLTFLCVPLYVLKMKHSTLFHPVIGRETTTSQDTCLTLYSGDFSPSFISMFELIDNKCDSSNIGGAVKWELLPKGSRLVINAVSVSNADFGESYIIHSRVPLGNIGIYKPQEFLSWSNGKQVEQSDLRRAIFFYPSFLMYWPMFPVFVFSYLPSLFI